MERKPTYSPSVPRIFDNISRLPARRLPTSTARNAFALGLKVPRNQERVEEVSGRAAAALRPCRTRLFRNVRNLFRGRIRQCVNRCRPECQGIL